MKRKKHRIWKSVVLGLLFAATAFFSLMPHKDKISTENIPEAYMVMNDENYLDYQHRGDCAGYAAAFAIRHFGKTAEGAETYDSMKKIFGTATLKCIQSKLNEYDLNSKAKYGDISSLKAEVAKGNPVIALVTIIYRGEMGLHYLNVVGYDEEYIYMSDSTRANSNIDNDKYCNRKLTYEEFETIWKTNVYPSNNVYIAIE